MNKLFGNLGLGQACTVQLEFRAPEGGALETVTPRAGAAAGRRDGDSEAPLPLFSNHGRVAGEVKVTPVPGRRVEHQGVRVQLVGEIELAAERGHPHEFLSLVRDLAPPGELAAQAALPFSFDNVELQYDSYRGAAVRLRYLLRVTVSRGMGQSVVRDFPFWVRNYAEQAPPPGPPIKMEVGIEDCLHIEFEYERGGYALSDVVVGKIFFLLVRIKLKHMELEVRRRETTGAGVAARSESDTLAKYEIMDGAPARGEAVPIRLFLEPYDLSPTYTAVHNRFSVKYFLNLVLVDEEDRRYFKQQEITLYRLREPTGDAASGSGARRTPRGIFALAPAPAPPLPAPSPAPADEAAGSAEQGPHAAAGSGLAPEAAAVVDMEPSFAEEGEDAAVAPEPAAALEPAAPEPAALPTSPL